MKKHPSSRSGVALILSLAFIVLVTIVIVGLMESMRTDRPAANSYFERAQAGQYAQEGVERVIALLGQGTADTERNWISQPGQLVIGAPEAGSGPDERKRLQTVVPLSSGLPGAASSDPALRPPDLNLPTFRNPNEYLITNGASAIPMPVKWVYVRKSGLLDLAETPNTQNASDPIVGRYAYWADDESSKVNYNLAWKRGGSNRYPLGHPTKVNLMALSGLTEPMADAIRASITHDDRYENLNLGFFNTPADARRVGPDVAEVLETHKFELTHYNHDPDTTFFNEPRFVLTTKASLASGRPFLDIYPNDTSDRARTAVGLDQAKVNVLLKKLVDSYTDSGGVQRDGYLKRTDWPMVSGAGSSFQQKYFNGNPDRLTQLALNIIDYVRSKEAASSDITDGLVAPIRGSYDAGGSFTFNDGSGANTYIGLSRSFLVSELGVWVDEKPNSNGNYRARFKIEVYLPEYYGLESVDMRKRALYLDFTNDLKAPDRLTYDLIANREKQIIASEVSTGGLVQKGGYAVLTRELDIRPEMVGGVPSRPTSILLRIAFAIRFPGSDRLEVVPVVNVQNAVDESKNYFIRIPIDPKEVPEEQITSLEVDDPRVNKHKSDWKRRASGNSFGAANSISTIGQSPADLPAGEPQQDTGSNGRISAASLYMPPPVGRTFPRADGTIDDNTAGAISSSGELGYIHTGTHSTREGVPWRTLRLQPSQQSGTAIVPDWALMDLFTPPVESYANARSLFAPHDGGVGGRVNLNAEAEPFGMERVVPLAAVLQDAVKDSVNRNQTVSATEAMTIATNIYHRTLALNGKAWGYADGYDSPGEVVEIRGVADGGEESEELVRQISNLITTRGNVFTVYSVGQAIKQSSGGKLTVTGEQRLQSVVERYLDSQQRVRFAPVYYRNLMP